MSWKMVKLQDLTENGFMVDGDWIESKDQDPSGGIRLLQLADIGDGYFIDKSNRFINQETSKKLKCSFLKKNDILIARMPDPIGRACVFPFEEENKHITVVDVCIMRIKNGVDPQYVTYAINSPAFRNKLESQITGTTRQRISGKNLKNIEIPLPPLATQKRIAEILDAADALRRKDQELLKKYDELAQAIFIDMFGDPVKNEKGWEVKKLDYFGHWRSGGTPSRKNKSFFHGKIPWVSSGELNNIFITSALEHISEEAILNSSTSLVEEGSLLLGMYDTAALKSSINKVQLCCNQAIAFSKLDDRYCNPLFLYFFIQLQRDELKKGQRGVRQKNLNLSMIKGLRVIAPPKKMQDEFAKRFEKIIDFKNIINDQKASNFLFDSLIQKAFKGELVA